MPIGDVEGEMGHRAGVAVRVCRLLDIAEHRSWLREMPLTRLPANAFGDAAELADGAPEPTGAADLVAGRREQLASVTLRSGAGATEVLVAVSAAKYPVHHLHLDGGHVVVAWRGRTWITVPGCQQYREGVERDYTVGDGAHNAPLIAGRGQDTQAVAVARETGRTPALSHVGLDLTTCYGFLPDGARVYRDGWLVETGGADRDRHCLVGRCRTGMGLCGRLGAVERRP